MNPNVQAILDAIKSIHGNINDSLAKLPPLEQFSANAEMQWPLQCIRDYGTRLTEQMLLLEGKMATVMAEVITAAATDESVVAAVRAELLKNGELIEKSTHDTAVTAAINTARDEARVAITAEFQRKADANAERVKLVESKELPQVLAERIADDDLLDPAKRTDAVAKLKVRGDKLNSLGLLDDETQVPFVAEIAALSLDEAGDTTFANRLSPIEAAIKRAGAGAAAPKSAGNPLAGGAPKTGSALALF